MPGQVEQAEVVQSLRLLREPCNTPLQQGLALQAAGSAMEGASNQSITGPPLLSSKAQPFSSEQEATFDGGTASFSCSTTFSELEEDYQRAQANTAADKCPGGEPTAYQGAGEGTGPQAVEVVEDFHSSNCGYLQIDQIVQGEVVGDAGGFYFLY